MALFHLYSVDLKYIRNLHNADTNVESQSPQINKETKVYLGIVIMVNEQKYCIPLSSGTKEKYQKGKSNIDLIKIPNLEKKNENGAFVTLAVLNINNMIPVNDSVIKKVDLHSYDNDNYALKQRKGLMRKELNWCRDNKDLIVRKAQKVYKMVTENPENNNNLVRRSCKFKKLEDVLEKYTSKNKTVCCGIVSPTISKTYECSRSNSFEDDDLLDLSDLTEQTSNRS